MTLKVTTEPRENRQLAVVIEVPQERVEKELQKAAKKVAAQYRIPGFRKGKAPYNFVVQQFGIANLYSEFVDDLGNEVFREALEQEKIEPYAMASMEDMQLEPLTYTLLVPLEPAIELGAYRDLRVEPESTEVTDEQVDARIEELREQYASWREVERASVYGDMMSIDVKAIIPATDEAEEIVVLDETDWDVTPDEENPMDPPGFDEALLGITPGESKEFTLEWPADSRSVYAGKSGNFNVTVHTIQAYDKPDLDDDFPALVGPDYASMEDLRTNIRETLAQGSEAQAEEAFLNKTLDAIVESATLDYPPAVIEDQLDSMLAEFERRLRQFGIESLDAYFSQVGQNKDEYRESLRDDATLQAKRNLVLSEIVRAEQLEVTPEELDAHIHGMVGNMSQVDPDQAEAMHQMLHTSSGASLIANDIIRAKAIRLILAIARGEEVPAAGEHPVLMPEGWEEHMAHQHEGEEGDEAEHDHGEADDHDHETDAEANAKHDDADVDDADESSESEESSESDESNESDESEEDDDSADDDDADDDDADDDDADDDAAQDDADENADADADNGEDKK